MLHHISFGVADLQRSGVFYDAALAPLGFVRVWHDDAAIGYGRPGGEDAFALKRIAQGLSIPGRGFHLAFAADARTAVDRFYDAALRQGGQDNGAPGLRPHYGEHYYAAFVIDPDGYPIEAVTKVPG
jgi:catechol 2,3-dioxygenase-like lactoylglutathione lyase family enzyme